MNILMVHPHDIYSASEPWTIRITSIAKSLAKKGHNIRLVYFPLPKKERGILKSGKITEYDTIPFNRSKWHILKNISRMAELGRWADIIYFQKCFAIASLPALFSAYFNKKHVHYDWDDWEYGIYMFSPPSRFYGTYLNQMEKSLPKLVDTMSVSSDELKKMALSLGFPEKKIIKLNVCADLERFSPKHDGKLIKERYDLDGPIVIYLGQLHGAQYAELLIMAAKEVTKKIPDVHFLIAGGGADLPRLKNIVSESGQENIIFTGFLPDDEINKALAAADVAVACFRDTKQVRCKSPLKIAEYLASGKAIVASEVGEIPWMTRGSAVLTKPGDFKSLANGIITLLENPDLRKELETKARKIAEEYFDWDIAAERLIRLFEASINKKSNHAENI